MPGIRIENEKQLIKYLKGSDIYKRFKNRILPEKLAREEKAWKLISENRGKYSIGLLNNIFDTIEFEYKSSGFKSHLKSRRKCHYVVCWEHNWRDCPIQVIELRTELKNILK
jgi:hypothetical protein